MIKTKQGLLPALLALCLLPPALPIAQAQGTAFTYQGQLNAGGAPANGGFDFTFALFNNSSANGGQVGATLTNLDVPVSNGLFTVQLDFGAVFAGNATWLAVGVRSNGVGGFTVLNPLQELTPTPYAMYAPNAGLAASANAVAATNIVGTLGVGQLPAVPASNIVGTIALGQLPAGVLSGNLANTAPQAAQRGVSAFLAGLQNLGYYQNLVLTAWFGPGRNYVSPENTNAYNVSAIYNNNSGFNAYGCLGNATNCWFTNTGLYLNGSNALVQYNLPAGTPSAATLIVFFTQAGWLQRNGGVELATLYNTSQSLCQMVLQCEGAQINSGGAAVSTTTPLWFGNWSATANIPYCETMTTDGQSYLSLIEWSALQAGAYAGWTNWTTYANIGALNLGNWNSLTFGSNLWGGFNGVLHGFVMLNTALNQQQVQQIFTLAQNTVLPWKRVVFEGDSTADRLWQNDGQCASNSAFWSQCVFNNTSVDGTLTFQSVDRFYPCTATNLPNGLDIVYPSTVIYWDGINDLGGIAANDPNYAAIVNRIESNIVWEVNAVHSYNSTICVLTSTESFTTTGVMFSNWGSSPELARVMLNQWERSGASGADWVVDNDTMFYNYLGANYWSNSLFSSDMLHPTNNPATIWIFTNISGVIGSGLANATNSLYPNPLDPTLLAMPGNASSGGAPSVLAGAGLTSAKSTVTNGSGVVSTNVTLSVAPGVVTNGGTGYFFGNVTISSATIGTATIKQTNLFVTNMAIVTSNLLFATNGIHSVANAAAAIGGCAISFNTNYHVSDTAYTVQIQAPPGGFSGWPQWTNPSGVVIDILFTNFVAVPAATPAVCQFEDCDGTLTSDAIGAAGRRGEPLPVWVAALSTSNYDVCGLTEVVGPNPINGNHAWLVSCHRLVNQ